MRQKHLIIAIALLAFAGAISLFTPAEAQKSLSTTSNFQYISHLDSTSDSNVTWDTLGMKTNERVFTLRLPVDFNRYVFYAYITQIDSGFAYVLDTDSGQVDLWFETSRNAKDWTQVATLSLTAKDTVYSDVRFVTVGDGANDTLYHRNWRVIQRIKSAINEHPQVDYYDTLTTTFSIEGRNVF